MVDDGDTGEDYGDPDYVKWAQREFTEGGCLEFAAAIHERHGWPLRVAVKDGTDHLNHAWVVRPDGRAVDALGMREHNHAHTWPRAEADTVSWATLAELGDRFGIDRENLYWARAFLGGCP